MGAPDPDRLMAAVDATWPPAEVRQADGWTLRRGAGGGKRVSAASVADPEAPVPDIDLANEVMRGWGQAPLYRLMPDGRSVEGELDAALEQRGYSIVDPVVVYLARAGELSDGRDETARVVRLSTRLALADEIWRAGGIGPARRAVMRRAAGPKTVMMARVADRAVGVAFVACDRDVAMIHAIEVLAGARRQGAGEVLLRGAASFAAEAGAHWLALAVTEANAAARALYQKLGMTEAGRYHYRCASGAEAAS